MVSQWVGEETHQELGNLEMLKKFCCDLLFLIVASLHFPCFSPWRLDFSSCPVTATPDWVQFSGLCFRIQGLAGACIWMIACDDQTFRASDFDTPDVVCRVSCSLVKEQGLGFQFFGVVRQVYCACILNVCHCDLTFRHKIRGAGFKSCWDSHIRFV
jgi:hypothetical protein